MKLSEKITAQMFYIVGHLHGKKLTGELTNTGVAQSEVFSNIYNDITNEQEKKEEQIKQIRIKQIRLL